MSKSNIIMHLTVIIIILCICDIIIPYVIISLNYNTRHHILWYLAGLHMIITNNKDSYVYACMYTVNNFYFKAGISKTPICRANTM